MRIALYSPYLDTASGGEKYILAIAEILSRDHQVDVLLDSHLLSLKEDLKQKNSQFHNLDLTKVNFISAPLGQGSSILERLKFLRQYDYLFFNSDGSFFLSTARHNVVHFQLPLDRLAVSGLWGQLKKSSWKLAIYNSKFTESYLKKILKINSQVVYPPVETDDFKPLTKKNQIVSVGRFVSLSNPKKQDFMIQAFKKFIDQNKKSDWSLHLAGGVMAGNEPFVNDLKELAKGYPIFFYPNISLTDLEKLYGESKIYWHAMGYNETDPKKFEHFGISTVEAMSAGCVPVVINKGGQPEIVENQKSGLLWDSEEQLIQLTSDLTQDSKKLQQLSLAAIERSKIFDRSHFDQHILEIVKG